MKRRIFAALLALLLPTMLLPALTLSAAAARSGDFAYTVSEDGTAAITDYFGDAAELSIPSVIDGFTVTRLAYKAFFACSTLQYVSIPDTVTEIGNGAFSNCTALVSVVIPESVTTISWYAFSGCSSLTEVSIPNRVTSLGNFEFTDCTSLKKVVIGRGMQEIADSTFDGCDRLRAVCFLGDARACFRAAFLTWDAQAKDFVVPAGLTLYYTADAEGWRSPSWCGYSAALWDGIQPPQLGAYEFFDVPDTQWYFGAVDYAVRNGLFNGTSSTTFAPNAPMNRAMLMTVLWRLEKQPKPAGSAAFADVPSGKWYTDAVLWAAENEIVNGVGNGYFDPTGNVTREQMATILFRYCEKKGIDASMRADLSVFPDAGEVSAFAKAALSWAVAEKLVGGTKLHAALYLDPKGSTTRAQIATVLMRFSEYTAK